MGDVRRIDGDHAEQAAVTLDDVASFTEERGEDGKRLVVRNGRARERRLTVGSGTVGIRAPRVNDKRVDEESGERQKFSSKILPAYARRSPKVTDVLPILYLRGLSTGDFAPALRDLLGEDASGSDQAGRWIGPSRLWTSVTPWVSEGDHAGRYSEHRRRCLLDSLAISILGDGDHVEQRLDIERLVDEAQVHDEAWVPGVEPASRSPELRPGPPMHARIAFREPVEGPIVIGRDRLFGMGLLAPLCVPTQPSW